MFPHSIGSIYSYRSILCPDLVLLVLVRSMFGSSHYILCYKFLPRTVNYVKNLNRALCALKEEQVIKMFGPHKYNYENWETTTKIHGFKINVILLYLEIRTSFLKNLKKVRTAKLCQKTRNLYYISIPLSLLQGL